MTGVARGLVFCVVCKAKDTSRSFFFPTPEAKAEHERISVRFVAEHSACRRIDLEQRGLNLDCPCVTCRAQRGQQQAPRQSIAVGGSTSQTRSRGYQRHRDAVLARDGWACMICGIAIDPEAGPFEDRAPALDHIEPSWMGGSDDIDNLRAAHRWCNMAREGNPVWSDDTSIREAAQSRFMGESS